jgi:SSS family solute:Na+ symporter
MYQISAADQRSPWHDRDRLSCWAYAASLHRALLLCALCLAPAVSRAGESESDDTQRRARCVGILRDVLRTQERWIKVHAAEYLLQLDYPEGVREQFEQQRLVYENEPEYRIGVWRVLAQADAEERRSAAWVNKIRDAFLNPAAADHLHAVESLAKLRYRVPPDLRPVFLQVADGTDDRLAIFAWWVLRNSDVADAESRLVGFLTSPNEVTRRLCGYVLFRLPTLSPHARQQVVAAVDKEPAHSAARVFLVSAAARHSTGSAREPYRQQLLAYLRTGDGEEKVRACEALAGVAEPGDLPRLLELLDSLDSDLRATSAWGILRLERRQPRRLQLADWVTIAVYGIGMLLVGWYYWRRNRSSEDYLLGGRTMKSLPVGLSLFATLFSTISYLAWPGEMIKYGPMILAICLSYPLVALVAGRFLIPHIMQLKITSAYELLEMRLGLAVRMLGSILFLLLRVLWMSVIMYATVGTVLIPLFGLSAAALPWVCLALGGVTLIYTAMGGLRAVVVTDVIQTLILFAGAIVSIVAVSIYQGGPAAWWPDRWQSHWTEPVIYDPTVRVTFVGAILAMFTWYISTAGSDQMAIQRYLATRDAPAARRVLTTTLTANALALFLLAALGLALLSYFQANPHLVPDGQTIYGNADQLFTRFIAVGLPAGFGGLVVAGLLAAAMSSLSAGINSSCSVVIADFVDRFGLRRRRAGTSAEHDIWLERIVSVVIGIIMVLLSSTVGTVHGNLLEVAYKVVNLLSAPLFGLFCMAMFVPWATSTGTLIGAVAGVVVVTAVNFWEELTGTKGISFLWAMPLSFMVQMIVGMLASWPGSRQIKTSAGDES